MPNSVSSSLPSVLVLPSVVIVRSPLVGAVQDHQTEAPPTLPAWSGSFLCFVALMFEPVTLIFVPIRTIRFWNWSFGGAWAKTFELTAENAKNAEREAWETAKHAKYAKGAARKSKRGSGTD